MNGALLNATSRIAILAAAGLTLSFSSASAADLGGNCCADLEERVAELEATTARKGNRKMSADHLWSSQPVDPVLERWSSVEYVCRSR